MTTLLREPKKLENRLQEIRLGLDEWEGGQHQTINGLLKTPWVKGERTEAGNQPPTSAK